MDGDREMRFISFNIPNLNYIEDEFGYDQPQPFRLPDAFEIRDALLSARQLGGTVVRLYTIPVYTRGTHPQTPTYVLGPNVFDENSFQNLDLVLAIANELGVRLIIPFINNWQWMGGRPQYADFRDRPSDDFWSHPQLVADAKATIAHVINRRNTITGQLYKDDKAIFCWETGNELASPTYWTVDICRYIKSLDANHLVMDGFLAIDGIPVQRASVDEPSIDIISSHHYESNPAKLLGHIQRNLKIINGQKPYVLGEFGFISTSAVDQLLDFVIDQPIAGAMIWSLRFHRREGGFYWHSEPLGHGLYKAYLWPGFATGNDYDESNLLALMRARAYSIRGEEAPPIDPPFPPTLLPITEVSHISWQGSAGAAAYDLERADTPEGPWKIAGYQISDADTQYFPLFNDHTAQKDSTYYYRVIAKNQAGNSPPSNVIGPVPVSRLALIDDMRNLALMYHYEGSVAIASDNDRVYREKHTRLAGDKRAKVFYYVPSPIKHVRLYVFGDPGKTPLEFQLSTDNDRYVDAFFSTDSLVSGKNDYGYQPLTVYEWNGTESDFRFLKISFKRKVQIARVEVYW